MSVVNHSQSGTPSTAQVSANIDWISVTAKHHELRENEHRLVLADDYIGGFEIVRATNGYNVARRYSSGAIMQWHTKEISMGVHVTYTAQSIRYACDNFGLSQHEIISTLNSFGKVTRLDVAMDVSGIAVDIRQLYADMLSGKVKTRARTFDYVETAKRGQEFGARTAYVGSMTKRKKLLRVYDKGMQLKLEDFMTRFELEQHGTLANNAAKILIDNEQDMGLYMRGMIKGYADFSNTDAGQYFTSVNAVKVSHPVYKKSDTARWLVDVVAPTLARESNIDYNVLSDFLASYKYHYERLQAERLYENE